MKKAFYQGTRLLEAFGGFQGFAAGFTGIYDGTLNINPLVLPNQVFFVLSVAVFFVHFLAVALDNLHLRHYTNLISAVIATFITIIIFKNHGFISYGVGGYGSLALGCVYCSFRTRYDFLKLKDGRTI